jgi:hypothetical protein
MDPVVIINAAVSTVEAKMTEEAALHPSPTPQPTATPQPTSTPTLEPTPTQAGTAAAANTAQAPAATTQASTGATQAPAAAPTKANDMVGGLSAKLMYVTTYPEQKLEYIPNEEFGLEFGFKNNGSVTWTPEYKLVIQRYEGELTAWNELKLGKTIAPGATGVFDLWAFGSETLGKHTWYYQLLDEKGNAVPGGLASFSYTSK